MVKGAEVEEVSGPLEIIEQSLVIETGKGSLIITGCAHPGIVDIIKEFRNMKIKYAGPTHCSGDKTLEVFKEKYGDNFIELGVGRVLKLSEL